MCLVVRPPPGSPSTVSGIVFLGVAAAFLGPWAVRLGAQDRSVTVPLDRSEIAQLLDDERPPTTLAVVGATRLDRVAFDRDVWLARDEYLAARLAGPAEAVIREGERLSLPIRYARPDASGRVGLRLVPAIELEGGGLRYDAEREIYEGSFLIGLQDMVQPEVRRPLLPPIRLRLSADAGTVYPSALALTHTNIPFTRVVVRARMPAESVAVRVRPEFDDRGVAVRLPVRPPAVSVTSTSHRILGFGLETVRITLTAPVAGLPGAARAIVAVDRGRADPAVLTLGHDGVAVVSLRSRGLGTATVTVTGPRMLSGTTMVEFVWPVTLLVAALLGAVVGVGAAALRERRLGRHPSLTELSGAMALGTVVGAVSATAIALATNATHVEIPIRLADWTVMLLAGMGARYGRRSIELAQRWSGAPEGTPR
jgi:hypothetical protein